MTSLTIDGLEDDLTSRLRWRAKAHGRSIEEEAAAIIRDALGNVPPNNGQRLLDTIRAEFGPLGGVELDIPPRDKTWEPPRFDDD